VSPGPAPALPEDLGPLLRHLEACYPEEGCGVLLRRGTHWRTRPLRNAYDAHRARAPDRYPRSARTAFLFEPREWLAVCLEADAAGEVVAAVFHSHPDGPPGLSGEDRAWAAPDGLPLLPGVAYLVVAVEAGRARAATVSWWEGGGFLTAGVGLGA
jgi:proteasome lid subunit RPN8/RPN11